MTQSANKEYALCTTNECLASECLKSEGSAGEEQTEPKQSKCVNDRRYERSKKMIYEALISLIEERGMDGFTVADLTNAADLNRSTFYSHYKDKDDLIKSCEKEFLEDLSEIEARIANVSPKELGLAFIDVKPLEVLVDLFEYLKQNRVILHALLGPHGDIKFERQLLDTVCYTLVHKVLDQKYANSSDALVKYYVSYFSSASLGVVRCWIETGTKESPEEMASILVHLAFINPGDPIVIGS